jgi:hypothetical protein
VDNPNLTREQPKTSLTKEREDALVREIVRDILALRKLTKECQTQTSRTQGAILQALEPKILTRVARVLAETEEAIQ